MKVCVISDSHGYHGDLDLPDADMLIHAGDFTMRGTFEEVVSFCGWLEGVKNKYKEIVVIAGNHDWLFSKNSSVARSLIPNGVHYLEDSGCVINGLNIWGSPAQPWFYNWAFNYHRGEDIARVWSKIPDNTDILITHGPPYGVLDYSPRSGNLGCEDLLRRINEINPKLVAFGHIHEGYGIHTEYGVTYVNGSVLDDKYNLENPCICVDI